ncbi:MAG: hypothetical protein EOM08_08275 [Clostridia bacterium]|nr:hypothetical protein [Clostridia bacterium]
MHHPATYTPGTIYHIIQRGNNHEFIFDAECEKRHFLQILRYIIKEMPCHVLYYVIMGNHYHLMLEMQDVPLNQIMQRVNLRYSLYFSRQNRRAGMIFKERMLAIPVKDPDYLRTLVAYLANNPVRAGITPDPESYKWSSHKTFLSNRPSFVAKDRLLNHIAPGLANDKAIALYQHIVRTYSKGKPVTQQQFIKVKRAADLRSIYEKLMQINQMPENDPALILEFVQLALEGGYSITEITRTVRLPKRTFDRLLADHPEITKLYKNPANE